MKFYINTLTFKNTIQAEQVFYSKEYSKLISPAMIENIILQTEDKKNIIELPLKIIKFVKKGDSKKTALPLDSEEKDIGFIIGYSPKERTEYVSNQIKAAHYKFEDVRKIKVIFKDIESMMNTSFISKETNQSIISDGGVFEKMGLNIGMNEEAFEKLNLQLELSRKENEEIKDYIDHVDEKLKASQTIIVEKEEVINVQQSKIDDLTIEKDKVTNEINHLQLEYDKTKQLFIDKEKEAENLRNEYNQNKNNFNAETEKLKSQLNTALEEAKALRSKLSELEQANGKLKNDIIALNNQIATLKAEVEKLKLQLAESQKHLQNMTIERDNQKVRADQGDNQVSALKQELNKAIGEWEKFRKYSMELEVQVQDLKKKYLAKVWKFKGALNRLNHTVDQKRLRINRINFELVIPQSGVLNSVSFVIGSKKDTRPVYGCQYGCHIFDTYFNNKHVGHFVINELEDYHYPHHWHMKKHSLYSSVQNLNMDVYAGDKIPISVQGDLMLLSNEVELCNLHDYEINMNFSRNHVI